MFPSVNWNLSLALWKGAGTSYRISPNAYDIRLFSSLWQVSPPNPHLSQSNPNPHFYFSGTRPCRGKGLACVLNEVGTLLNVLGHRHGLQGRGEKSGSLLVFLWEKEKKKRTVKWKLPRVESWLRGPLERRRYRKRITSQRRAGRDLKHVFESLESQTHTLCVSEWPLVNKRKTGPASQGSVRT